MRFDCIITSVLIWLVIAALLYRQGATSNGSHWFRSRYRLMRRQKSEFVWVTILFLFIIVCLVMLGIYMQSGGSPEWWGLES
jgi:ABC-type Fe3+ transport system permease subunit